MPWPRACRPDAAEQYRAFAAAGATWMLTPLNPGITLAEAMAAAAGGPDAFFGI